ncbi:hypothetical protein [Amphritea sp.]|uniref:hypothetical protein n=1 Tax=Amphritea sp. TaxID=1872502 RepID=UPI003A958055
MFTNESLEVYLEIAGSVTQAELPGCREKGLLGDYAVAYRIFRNKQGGGFGDPDKHPYAWAAIVYVDGLPLRLNSARGDCREWSTLDRIGQWMVDNGFRYWWTRNDLEYVESPLLADALTAPAADIAAESSLGVDAELPINPDADSYVI